MLSRPVFVLTSALLCTLALVPPAQAGFPGNNGKIAFQVDTFAAPADVYSMNADGSNRTNLTGHPEEDRAPAWSPDGTKVAFAGYRDGDYEIYTMNPDGTAITNLTNHAAFDSYPTWSPDGTKLAFVRAGGYDIYSMNADGSGQINLTGEQPLSAFEPSWSPDGSKIAYSYGFGHGGANVWVMNSDGSGKTPLTDYADPDTGESPEWSPDGTRIAYSAGTDITFEGNFVWDLRIMNPDGSGNVAAIHTAGDRPDPAWSPNGKRIAIVKGGIAAVDPDGSNLTQISSGDDFSPSWQPIVHDHPESASTLRVSLVPALRQTISTTQCQARGGTPSQHGSPLSFTSCNPPAYLPNTAARLGPDASGYAQLTVVPGDLFTAADEADGVVVVNATDMRNRQTGSDYDPSASAPDVTLTPVLRISDTHNGSPPTSPATTSDFVFPVPVACAATADPVIGSSCSAASSFDAITPGAIREGRKTSISTWRLWLYDSGANGVRGDADDRQFAQQGIYIP